MAGEKKKAGNSRLKAFLIVVIGIIVIISFQYYILPFVETFSFGLMTPAVARRSPVKRLETVF